MTRRGEAPAMKNLMSDQQIRAIEQMGLGPLWVRRRVDAPQTEDAIESAEDRVAAIAAMSWDRLRQTVSGCRACRLCETRTQTVFGIGGDRDSDSERRVDNCGSVTFGGSAHPDWMIIGEAPGAEEDACGEPFVGQAGRLLDAMLASVGLSRERNVFIANVLKCRPPGNRDPAADEVMQCLPFLHRQIELLAPRMILVVGKFASAALLGREATIASLRGKEHRVSIAGRAIPVVVTYHPAYLLRSPQEKAKAWTDLCLARRVYENSPSAATT